MVSNNPEGFSGLRAIHGLLAKDDIHEGLIFQPHQMHLVEVHGLRLLIGEDHVVRVAVRFLKHELRHVLVVGDPGSHQGGLLHRILAGIERMRRVDG